MLHRLNDNICGNDNDISCCFHDVSDAFLYFLNAYGNIKLYYQSITALQLMAMMCLSK